MTETSSLLGEVPSQPGDAAFLATLAERLAEAGRWADVLEVRLMQARLSVGLAVDASSADVESETDRTRLDGLYVEACEEVGRGLLGEQKWAEAWRYLSAAGRPEPIRDALAQQQPDEAAADELIEVALYHRANPAAGFGWLLRHYGTCNSVTTLEGMGPELPPADLSACVSLLVAHLYDELLAALRLHITQVEETAPAAADLPALLAGRPWLFEAEASHVDASHLSAAVRLGRVLTEEPAIRLAFELADYGGRLHPSLHYGDAAPFEDLYPAHRRFYGAQLGEGVDEAVAYFRQRADEARPEADGLAPLETLLVLLHRLGRGEAALAEFGRLAPAGAVLSPYAPQPLEMARASGAWDAYDRVMSERGDVVAVAKGRLARP
ncbi:MAG: hypothetical protein AAGJ46_08095 [Planctomycetota bacterium]